MSDTYSLTSDDSIVVRSDGANIPNDPRNADWQRYQAWLAAGNTPSPYVAPPQSAPIVTSLQFRRLFTAAEQVAITTAAAGNIQLRIWLDDAAAAGTVDMGAAEVTGGIAQLVAAGLLTQDRADAILAGQALPA